MHKSTNTFYTARSVWDGINKKRRTIKMHRQIINPPHPLVVDHINRNGLDDRKANLRPTTKSQNCLNRQYIKPKNSPSKYKGVTWHKSRKKWRAQICFNGIQKNVGYFNDEIEAAKKYHGEFAHLDF